MKNKILSIAAAITVAANLITPVLAVETASGNTASGNTVTEETTSDVNGSVAGIDGAFFTSDSSDLSDTTKPVIVINEDGDEVAAVKAEISGKTVTQYVSGLGDKYYSAVCNALSVSSLNGAEIAGVFNIDANSVTKNAIKAMGGSTTLTIPVSGIVSTDRVAVIHYHGTEKYVLPAVAGDGTVSFTITEEFCPYVIIKLPEAKKNYLRPSSSSPSTSTSSTTSTSASTTATGYAVPNTAVK